MDLHIEPTYFQYLFIVPIVAIAFNIMLKASGRPTDKSDWLVCYEFFLASIACLLTFYGSSKNNAISHEINKDDLTEISVKEKFINCPDCGIIFDSLSVIIEEQDSLKEKCNENCSNLLVPAIFIFLMMNSASFIINKFGTEDDGKLTFWLGLVVPNSLGLFSLYYACNLVTAYSNF